MKNLNIEDYQVKILENDFHILFQMVFKKCGNNKMYVVLNHIVENPELDEAINKFNRERNLPEQYGIINPLTRSVLDNCRDLSYQIMRIENKNKLKIPIYVITNLKLLAYLQVIETKYIFKVIANMLKVLLDEEPQGELFDDSKSGNESFKKTIKIYERVKEKYGVIKCIEKWKDLFLLDLRNAIAHNDYYIDKTTKYVSIPKAFTVSLKANPNISMNQLQQISYSQDEINKLHLCSKQFNEAFNNTIDNWFFKLSST